MNCLICSHKDTKVIDSRLSTDGLLIRRRRECEKCGFRFSTTEESDILDLSVVKRDGSREPYVRDKIINGLRRSLEKRPYTKESFKNLIQKIERDIHRKKKAEITSLQIGEIIMRHLRSFDEVAYIRFASVYRSFNSISGFTDELREMKRKQQRVDKQKPRQIIRQKVPSYTNLTKTI